MWLREKQNLVLSEKIKHITAIGVILFCIATVVEREIYAEMGYGFPRDHYFFTLFLAVSLFLFFANWKQNRENWISKIGREDSLYIYIFHPIFLTIYDEFNGCFSERFNVFYPYVEAVVAFVLSIFLCWGLRKIRIIK